jgi:hypothetical protein
LKPELLVLCQLAMNPVLGLALVAVVEVRLFVQNLLQLIGYHILQSILF